MEIDPRTLGEELASVMVENGVTRVSLGVQDFEPKVQDVIGRIQPFEMVQTGVNMLRQKGINKFNLDMMYGLPLQTEASIEDNIRKVLELAPDRCSLFGYAHVPWMKSHQKKLEAYALPDNLERYKQFSAAKRIFNAFGYESIGIDHFAVKGDSLLCATQNKMLRRNFQGYTADQARTLIGLGASAISQTPAGFVQNDSSLRLYKESLKVNNALPIVKGFVLNDEDKVRSAVISSLMCFFEVNLGEVCGRLKVAQEYMDAAQQELQFYEQKSLVTIKDYTISIVEEGRFFTRLIASCFDAFSANNANPRASRL